MSEPIPEIQSAYCNIGNAIADCNAAHLAWGDWPNAKMHIHFALESLESARAKIESLPAAITGTIPEPKHMLRWGEDIPPAVMTALRNGETAMLHDAEGKPYSLVLIDYFGTIREKRVSMANDQTDTST